MVRISQDIDNISNTKHYIEKLFYKKRVIDIKQSIKLRSTNHMYQTIEFTSIDHYGLKSNHIGM